MYSMQVQQHMVAAAESHKHVQIWGSSIGWLAFYTALTYGVHVVGEGKQAPRIAVTVLLDTQHVLSDMMQCECRV